MIPSAARGTDAPDPEAPPEHPLPASRRERATSRRHPSRLTRIFAPARRPGNRSVAGSRTGVRARLAAGLLILPALFLGALPQAAQAQGNNVEVFSTTMTVGTASGFAGYNPNIGTGGIGSVGTDTFTHRGHSFTLNWLYYLGSGVTSTAGVTFRAESTEPSSWASAYRLCLDGHPVFRWDNNSPVTDYREATVARWTRGQTIALKLVAGTGCATAALTASEVKQTGGTLTIQNREGAWWYRQTSPELPNCRRGGTSTAGLAGLTGGETYEYKAYSDSTCTAELATVMFTTPDAEAGSIGETGATLTVEHHPSTWYHKRTAPTTGTPSCSAAQTGTTAALTGLTPGTEYTWTTYSNSACTTELASVMFTTLAVPTDVTVTVASPTSLLVRWRQVEGADNYQVRWYDPQLATQAETTESTSHVITGLTTGLQYTVYVNAFGGGGHLFSYPPKFATPTESGNNVPVFLEAAGGGE